MNFQSFAAAIAFILIPTIASAQPSPGNRLAYLEEVDPYYPHAKFPKLITPQWVGEPGVEAVVILAIDDMRDTKRYEAFLRPLLRRLKEIDGRAPVSIMTNQVDPKDPQLQAWLKEGLSLESHTLDHPCPFFKDGFAKAKATYDNCVDLMNAIPNNKPVAFRMPCCDSLNTPSPRFYAEIFNKTTPVLPSPPGRGEGSGVRGGNFLSIDSSVFNVFTADDPELPRDLVLMPDGTERFRKYLPKDRSFVNTIENYPYPYVIGRLCWQFPCMTPSDWLAQHLHKPNNPQTVKDWQAAVDCTVIKKGVMAMVFHPHGWIKSDQLVELVDYADKKYGKKVTFLNFREALERLEKNALSKQSLRHPKNGQDNGVRLLDLHDDGFLDVVVSNAVNSTTRLWLPKDQSWKVLGFPLGGFDGGPLSKIVNDRLCLVDQIQFGFFRAGTFPSLMWLNRVWHFDGKQWTRDVAFGKGLDLAPGLPVHTSSELGGDCGVRLLDLNGDGIAEVIAGGLVFTYSEKDQAWGKMPFGLPSGISVVDSLGKDNGFRFVDLAGHGQLDIVTSNEKEYGVYLIKDMKEGWSRKVIAGKAGDPGALPMISNKGENMGFFVHSGRMWWSNETTALLKDHVARVSIQELLKDTTPKTSFKR